MLYVSFFFFLQISSLIYATPSAAIDPTKTAFERIDPFSRAVCSEARGSVIDFFFRIDYDRQSARVTNGELLRRLLAARRVRGQRNRTAGHIQVHNWPIISPGRRASQAPLVFGLCCSQRPRVGGNLALGCSSVRAF